MNKKKKYYVVNNQEDEDGYILYPENAINNEYAKSKLEICRGNNTAMKEPRPAKQQFRSFILSPGNAEQH
jgi:hypothetical protein